MIRRILLIALFAIFSGKLTVNAQDVAVISISAPASGCSLTSTENVVVRIFNYGPTDLSGMAIPVSYSINGGAAITESATFPSFLQNSTVTYTFTTQANLSVAATYTFAAATALAGDVNTTNDAFTGYTVTNTAPSVGGTVAGGTNVCLSGNSGNLTLSGNTGTVQNWEYSTDGGSTWINISNTTTTQSYSNITIPTRYRATVQNGACAQASSAPALFTIDPVTVGGTVATSATVCTGSSGTLTLSGKTGTVQSWESSPDGITWTTIANVTTSQAYTALATTTRYRANVKSGSCSALTSSTATITVSPVSVGGTIAPAAVTVCSGSNSGTLTLSGHTGTVSRWEFSTDGGTTWTNVANTTTSLAYTNLAATRIYRALVKSGACSALYSASSTITVSPASVGGSVSANATVCSGINGATLTLSGHAGSILNWEFSIDGGTTYTPIANTTTTQAYSNLVTTTIYRAVVQNGTCTVSNSGIATITVNSSSVGGTLSSNDTVCASANSGSINLAGHTGSIQKWEFSNDNGTTWTNIVNTTTSNSFTNLTDTTLYRASIKNGVCAAVYSDTVEIVVDPVTVGGSVAMSGTVCSGLNSNTVNLSGNTGNVQNWEYSTDGGVTWVNIVNTTTSQAYNNITSNTIYHALVKSGVCAAAYSGSATLTVDPQAVGGTTYGTATVCQGANTGTISLVGHSVNVADWESSIDGGTSWTSLGSTAASFNYTNLTQSTIFRAITSSGVCPNDTSSTTVISVDIPSVGGVVSVGDTVCEGNNAGTLSLSGHTGNILNWEYSTDNGTSWILLSNSTTSQNYSNLIQSTYFRANVKNGVCASDLADSVYIKVDSAVVAGSISSAAQLCISNSNGTLNLAGYTGSIVDWQSSSDNGATWLGLTNTTNSYTYASLTDTTYYRAIVSSGVCGNDTTSSIVIGVDALSNGGVISSSDTVCASGNGATLTLGSYTGSIQGWEYSADNGNSWVPLSNTSATQTYTNLASTMLYRAYVKNGVCPVAVADTAIITVDPVVVAGTISSAAQLCISNANGTLNLAGYTGSIVDWQSSSDNGATWLGLTNTANSYSYTSLTDTTYYRAIVSSGVCGNDTTSTIVIGVDALSNGGVISSSDTVCASGNGATLSLGAYTGNIQGWEYSSDNGNSWVPLSNTSATQTYTNLASTMLYRAYVKNGVCPVAVADTAIITVDPVVEAGTISSAAQLCISNANGTLNLAGYTGSIVDWQSSSDNGATWLGLTNTANSYSYTSLTDTTYYRAIVSSGVCGNDTTSTIVIGVDALSNGGVISSSDTVCASGNGATLTLGSYTGSIQGWEYSSDNGNSWVPLSNTSTTQTYTNLASTMLYRAYVKNGVCPVAVADTAIIKVDPVVEAGTISSAAQLCISNANGTLSLNGYVGNILEWQYMDTLGIGWHPIANTSNINSYASLTDTTYYRAIVSSGVCGNDTTSTIVIGVDQLSIGGSSGLNDTVCASLNGDTLALTAYNGTIVNWEYSTNNGNSWSALTNNNDSLVYSNLSTSTVYHAIVKNGVCPPVYSSDVTIKVDAVTNSGFITGGNTACELHNSGVLNLNGSVGVVLDWIYSNDNGITWTSTTVDSLVNYTYSNLGDTTWFKAIVKNGVCATDTSNAQTVYIYPNPIVTLTLDTVCLSDTTHIVGSVSIPSGIIQQYKLNFGDGTVLTNMIQNHVYAVADTFNVSLLAYSTFGCSDTAFAKAIVKRIPSATILHSSPLSFCPGDSTLLNFSLDSNAVFTWSTLATDTFTVVDSTVTVLLTVTDTLNGCSAIDSVHVVKFQLDSISAGLDTTIALGSSFQLQGYGTGTVNWTPASLLDFPLILNPTATLVKDTMFVMQITDANSCVQRDTVLVTVNFNYVFDVKDIITPNNDGMNDVWYIKNIDSYKDNEVTVFNRDGNIVYHKKEYTNDWEGTFNGQQLPDGAYFYVIKFDNNEKVLKGSINILTNK